MDGSQLAMRLSSPRKRRTADAEAQARKPTRHSLFVFLSLSLSLSLPLFVCGNGYCRLTRQELGATVFRGSTRLSGVARSGVDPSITSRKLARKLAPQRLRQRTKEPIESIERSRPDDELKMQLHPLDKIMRHTTASNSMVSEGRTPCIGLPSHAPCAAFFDMFDSFFHIG